MCYDHEYHKWQGPICGKTHGNEADLNNELVTAVNPHSRETIV